MSKTQEKKMKKLFFLLVTVSTYFSIAYASSNMEKCTIGLKSYVPTTYDPLVLINSGLKNVDLVPKQLVISRDLYTKTFKYGKQTFSDCKLRFNHYIGKYRIIENARMDFGDQFESYERKENTCSIKVEKFPSSLTFMKLPKMSLPQGIESYQFDGNESRLIKLVNTTLNDCMKYAIISIMAQENDKILKETLEFNNKKYTLTSKYLQNELIHVQNQGTGGFMYFYTVRDLLDENYYNGFSYAFKLPKINKQTRMNELSQEELKESNGQPHTKNALKDWLKTRGEF